MRGAWIGWGIGSLASLAIMVAIPLHGFGATFACGFILSGLGAIIGGYLDQR